MSNSSNDSNRAQYHNDTALHASTAAAIAAGIVYEGIWFNVAGALDIVDLGGTKKTVTGAIGSCYPCKNYGAVTGGGTTLTAAQFLTLKN